MCATPNITNHPHLVIQAFPIRWESQSADISSIRAQVLSEIGSLEAATHDSRQTADRFSSIRRSEVLEATKRVMDAYLAQESLPPPLIAPEFGAMANELRNTAAQQDAKTIVLENTTGIPIHPKVPQENIPGWGDQILRIRLHNELKIFRSNYNGLLDIDTLRKTAAAARLNALFGIDTVPAANFALVNGLWGVVSDFAPGLHFTSWASWQIRAATHGSWSDTMAFEFLTGNLDLHERNAHLDRQGHLRVFDHNWAFPIGLMMTQNPEAFGPFGTLLPRQYTARFIAGLQALTNEKLLADFGSLLSPLELQAVALRRDIIAADIMARWPQALMKPEDEDKRPLAETLLHSAQLMIARQ